MDKEWYNTTWINSSRIGNRWAIQKQFFESIETTLIISNDEMDDTMKKVKSLDKSRLLTNNVSETIKNERKGKNGVLLSMLLGTWATAL